MMSEMLVSLIVVLIIVSTIVFIYRWQSGNFPGSKLIIEDPPVEHNGLEPKQARFMFFFTTWCPYCKTAQAPWRSFKQELKNNPVTYGDYNVIFEEINAEANKSKSALYKVEAYPTFKIETQKKVIEMKGVPDPLNFDAFLIAALGKKVPQSTSPK
jgi:thiol-disulfide isomerase/thioredoxin